MTSAMTDPGFGHETTKDISASTVKSPKPKALIIDEDIVCRMIEQAFIGTLGVETDAVDNTPGALDLLASGAQFDFILIERNMRNPNGMETVRQMRAMGVQSRIVVVSVEYFDGEKNAFAAAGADLCIGKPFYPETLARAFEIVPSKIED